MSVAYQEFSDWHCMNADYADFASIAIGEFRDALRDPELTREDLKYMLRRGMNKHRNRNSQVSWTKYVASYMARSSNANSLS